MPASPSDTSRMPRPRRLSLKLPMYVYRSVARGREYWYFQRGKGTERQGPRIALPHVADPEFWPAYYRAAGKVEPRKEAGTFAALIDGYKESPEWRQLSDASRRDYARHLADIARMWGDLMVRDLEASDVLELRDKRSERPGSANYLVRVLSTVISWGIPRGYRRDNPCAHVRKLKLGEGSRPWPWPAIERVRAEAPPELWQAAALALYTGQRQRDVLAMTWTDVKDGVVSVLQSKTGIRLTIPIHRDLAAVLAGIDRRAVQVLTSSRGQTWTQDGFRASWSAATKRLGLDLVFHGLRKSAVVMLLEAGCTDAEVSAITGQSRQMVAHYAKQVNQSRLAAAAILRWENAGST